MELSELINSDSIVSTLKVGSKKQALQELAQVAESVTGISSRDIFGTVLQRERLGSTGVGQGIAIPHGKLDGLDRLFAIFARLDTPIGFDAMDDQPVDLIFMLLAPESAGADHLKALARISRTLRDPSITQKLRDSASTAEIYAILTQPAASHAA
jgi:PTS system nitrogen regulatory IIA component